MITDPQLSPTAAIEPSLASDPRGALPLIPSPASQATLIGSAGVAFAPGPILPVLDIRSTLATRRATPHYADDQPLFVTLPLAVKAELRALLGTRPGGGAFGIIAAQTAGPHALSITRAVKQVVPLFPDHHWHHKTLRARYDAWVKTGDWVSLVNRAKAGAEWQDRDDTLPADFLFACAMRFAQFKRADAKKQALLSLKRQWQTGRNDRGEREPVPGYGDLEVRVGGRVLHAGYWQQWWKANHTGPLPERAPLMTGWSYSNILRQIKARNLFPKATQGLLHEGTYAGRKYLPTVQGTREGLRFMEKIQFDDVKVDWLIFDPVTGQTQDLWLLIAHDVATTMLLGFGLRPARTRDDGTQEHLKLADMKQLLGWLLDCYGLPPYTMHWWFERGTATVASAVALAIEEMLGPDHVACHWTGMIGGASPTGYAERRIGNSGAKGSLEACNRLLHTIGANLPSQTGPLYQKRPSDLVSRVKENEQTWKLSQFLPEHLRGQLEYSTLDITQARQHLRRIAHVRNSRTDHECEGFETVIEWVDSEGRVGPQNTIPHPLPEGARILPRRKESPIERATRLVKAAPGPWTPVSPEIITALFETSQRESVVQENGELRLRFDDRPVRYRAAGAPLIPGTKVLAYFHPDDPKCVHVTDGRGSFLGTCYRVEGAADPDALSQAIRYSAGALKAARAQAQALAAPDADAIAAMRARNAARLADFVPAAAVTPTRAAAPRSTPVAAALASIPIQRRAAQASAANDAALAASLDAV